MSDAKGSQIIDGNAIMNLTLWRQIKLRILYWHSVPSL